MSFFNRLFTNENKEQQPDIRFGRYSDVYHTVGQDEAFDQAVQHFEEERYIDSYKAFFNYLRNEEEGNIQVWEEKGTLKFELYQGSKKVTGYGNAEKLYARARVAKAKRLQASFMRRLLDKNYELKYSRFTLTPEDEIAIVFDTYTTDGSPFKLYAALKELATHADKHDDILIDEFDALEESDLNVKRQLPDWEKEVKYNYLVREIQAAFHEIDHGKLNADKYPIGITYLLLFLCYKLDYLIKPEGHTMEALERIHRLAYEQDGKNTLEKNRLLRQEFQKLLDRPKEQFFKEMYEVRATFGITAPIEHQKVSLAIEQELVHAKWYQEQGYDKIAIAIPGFIASRCLFYFAVPKPDKDLFHLLLQILEADYFKELGFKTCCQDGQLEPKRVKKAIRKIVAQYEQHYPSFSPDVKKLNYGSMPEFAESFCWMIKSLEF